MTDILEYVGPLVPEGGRSADYVVEVLSNGGLGIRDLPSKQVVPHVLSKLPSEALTEGVSTQALQALPQIANTALAAANLGVGLLNLGVSAWTAWKVHKMDGKLDVMQGAIARVDGKVDRVADLLASSVTHLDGLIRGNALMLGLLIEHQGRLAEGISVLRQELARGFTSVHAALTSTEARREAHELEQQMRALFKYYEVCSREMQANRQPPAADLRRIVDVATGLTAWLETRLGAMPRGRPERLPLFVARAYALRLEIDARSQLDEASGSRDGDFEQLRSTISEELRVLTEAAPLFALAEERRALVEQYVYLHRSTRMAATMIAFPDGRVLPFYPARLLEWNDGLDGVRALAAERVEGNPPSRIELETLEEHAAWQRLSGLPRGASDDEVEVAELFRRLGLPLQTALSKDAARALLRIAPAAEAEARIRVKNEVE